MAKQRTGLLDLLEEVRQLKAVIKEKDKKIEEFEKRVDDLEQFTRMDDLVISGLEMTHHTYSRITARDKEGEDALNAELQTLEHQVIQFLDNKEIPITREHISACHSIPQRQRKSPNIIVRFVKNQRLSQCA